MLKTSAGGTLYSGQFRLSTQLLKLNYLIIYIETRNWCIGKLDALEVHKPLFMFATAPLKKKRKKKPVLQVAMVYSGVGNLVQKC